MNLPERVLVTGGAGYIGSHCCKALADVGVQPVVFDNLSRGHADAVRWGPLVVGDLRDRKLLSQTLEQEKIEAVIHFAALAYVGESVEKPQLYYDNNVGGMLSLLGVMADIKVETVVFSSSCATYGVPKVLPIRESTEQVPINPYGRTKLICEWMLEDAARSGDLNYAALRYFNAAGADPDGELAERHNPETHLVPLAIMAALGTSGPLQILGTDYPTSDGTCIRDYIHVSDLARAHVLALEKVHRTEHPLEVNLGTGKGTSVWEIVNAVERVTGHDVPLIKAPRRAGDPPELVACPDLAQALLGFKAQYSDIDEIVRDAAPWFARARAGDI
ncbi:UDP-L-arabinose 4-epimerase [Shimia gijangensis]|uniref:UDP-glucose 4-epimerase n=1 Tax=Shimia gijangensis TaxID=1470563 RepID=A0A1M6D9D8_9RHOB|nr:UDP-glucose 4-epimerase GalE [Shimia gijangensis]SHI69814.1 UDP-L-arabinose 4-epimerase [Shimia gijangensis]